MSLPNCQNQEIPALSVSQLEDMMKIADPVCFGSMDLSVDPAELFEIAFARNYSKFLTDLNELTKQTLANTAISEWADLSSRIDSEQISSFKCRLVKTSRRSASPWSWMNTKPSETIARQYCVHHTNGWTVYCISHPCERRAIRTIEKYDVQLLTPGATPASAPLSPTNLKEPVAVSHAPRVRVVSWASAHLQEGVAPSFVAFTKATSASRVQFGKWKMLVHRLLHVTEPITSTNAKSFAESGVDLSGVWNKLGSRDQITLILKENRLVHQDGHAFPCSIVSQTDSATVIRSQYGNRLFDGTVEHAVPDHINWSNGSSWIRNGFHPFAGMYVIGATGMKARFLQSGEIRCQDGTNFQVVLSNRHEIERVNGNSRSRSFAEHVGNKLIWNDDVVWTRLSETPIVSKADVCHQSSRKMLKVPDHPAPSVPQAPPSEDSDDAMEDDEEDLIAPAMAEVLEDCDEENEPSVSASYSLSVEQITHYNLEKIVEFEDWLVVDDDEFF